MADRDTRPPKVKPTGQFRAQMVGPRPLAKIGRQDRPLPREDAPGWTADPESVRRAEQAETASERLLDELVEARRKNARLMAENERLRTRQRPPSLHDADFEESTEQRLQRLESRHGSRPPGPIRWLWGTLELLPGWGRVLIVLAVLAVAGWRGAAFLGWVP